MKFKNYFFIVILFVFVSLEYWNVAESRISNPSAGDGTFTTITDSGALTVTGLTTMTGGFVSSASSSIRSSLNVVGNLNASSSLFVGEGGGSTGYFYVNGTGNVFASGTLRASGLGTFSSGFISNASSSIASTLNVVGNLNASSSLFVGSAGGTTGYLYVNGANGNVFTSGTLQAFGASSTPVFSVGGTAGTASVSTTGKVQHNKLLVSITANSAGITTSGELVDCGAGTCIPSAQRFKTKISDFTESGLKEILGLKVKNYERIDQLNIPRVGFIAEDVEKVNKDLVVYKDGETWTLNFEDITALSVKAIQELNKKIQAQEKEIKRLEQMIRYERIRYY